MAITGGRRAVGACSVGAALILATIAPVVAFGDGPVGSDRTIFGDPGPIDFTRAATAGRRPERAGSQFRTRPLPEPPVPGLEYPTGACDTIVDGLPGLELRRAPSDYRLVGSSVLGRPIWAEYWGPPDATQVVVVIGNVHGDECSPTLLVEAIRASPPEHYGIWLIPVLNPDGYAAYERRNAEGVDLNTDGGRRSQPETRALDAFLDEVRPKMTLHVHSPNGFVGTYPQSDPNVLTMCGAVESSTEMRCGRAGSRDDRDRWTLWQGRRERADESALLVELFAVSDDEVPHAEPRPPTRTVERVRSETEAIVVALHDVFGP